MLIFIKDVESCIYVENKEKWNKFSLLKRDELHIPSTTNNLKSVHGFFLQYIDYIYSLVLNIQLITN